VPSREGTFYKVVARGLLYRLLKKSFSGQKRQKNDL